MARRFWLPGGIAAGAFLFGMAYVGWWYQGHVQAQFFDLVEKIDKVNEVDARENEEFSDEASQILTVCDCTSGGSTKSPAQ